MGQRQFLLILLGILLVVLNFYAGLTMDAATAQVATRNAVIHDLQTLSAEALNY